MGIDVTFISHIKEVSAEIEKTAKERMEKAVVEVRNEVLQTLSGNRSGRTYKVPGTQKIYTASSPGEPPASATGALRQSITFEVEGEGKKIIGRVGSNTKYAPMLEFGTSRMAARPWLRKSFEQSEQKVEEIFTRIWF